MDARRPFGDLAVRLVLGALLVASSTLFVSDGSVVRAQTGSVTFGVSARPRSGESQRDAVENLEEAIGREFGGIRVYKRWDHSFPTDYDRWLRDSGHTLYLSIAAQRNDGSLIPWRQIADAATGSALHDDMVRWANRIGDFGATVYVAFSHEPETENSSMGNQGDFIDAWRRIVTVFRNNGATNARFMMVLTAFTYARNDGGGAWSWYPGDDYVDAIGADGYNFAGCRAGVNQSWRPFDAVFEPVRVFAASHPGKPVIVAEWGSVEDPSEPGRKAGWIRGAMTTLSSPGWEQFRAVLYWHSEEQFGDPPCRFWVDSSPGSLSAFAEMGANPHFFLGSPPQITSLSPSKGPVGTIVRVSGQNFSDVTTVSFDGVAATFSVDTLSALQATVPPGATAGPVSITTGFGSVSGPLFSVVHRRSISLDLSSENTATGRVSVGDGFATCASQQSVNLQRRIPGKGWRTILRTDTNSDGTYRANLPDRPGKYRARTPRTTLPSSDICGRSRSPARR